MLVLVVLAASTSPSSYSTSSVVVVLFLYSRERETRILQKKILSQKTGRAGTTVVLSTRIGPAITNAATNDSYSRATPIIYDFVITTYTECILLVSC